MENTEVQGGSVSLPVGQSIAPLATLVTPSNVGRWCLSEDECIDRGIDFAAYERGVADAAEAFGRNVASPKAPVRAATSIRVACISLDGITLTVPADQLNALGVGKEGDNDTYALTFKTMTRAEYEALGEFDGF